MDKIGKYLLLVVLYDEGEPLLNPQLPEIVRYTNRLNISTSISTNLSMELSDEYIMNLITSGLDRMTVSMDGMTQEIYGRYRIGGDLKLLKENLKRLLSYKKQARSKTFIEVQFIDFGFNAYQMSEVKDYAYKIGANNFKALFSSVTGLEEYLATTGRTLTEKDHLRLGCLDVWSIAHISSDGRLFPCDFGEDNGMPDVGNVFEEDFRRLWNSPYVEGLRAMFHRGNTSLHSSICRRCPSTNKAPRILR